MSTERGALGQAKALQHIGEVRKRKAEGKSPPLALCPRCEEPLISTFAFPGSEFFCICCGAKVTFLGPKRGDGDDPKLQARYEELEAEWDENVGSKLMPRGEFWQTTCEQCGGEHGPRPAGGHHAHATDAEREADKRARAWLKERTSSR